MEKKKMIGLSDENLNKIWIQRKALLSGRTASHYLLAGIVFTLLLLILVLIPSIVLKMYGLVITFFILLLGYSIYSLITISGLRQTTNQEEMLFQDKFKNVMHLMIFDIFYNFYISAIFTFGGFLYLQLIFYSQEKNFIIFSLCFYLVIVVLSYRFAPYLLRLGLTPKPKFSRIY